MLKKSGLTKDDVTKDKENADVILSGLDFLSKDRLALTGKKKAKLRLQDLILPDDPSKVFGKLSKIDEGSTGNVYKSVQTKNSQKVRCNARMFCSWQEFFNALVPTSTIHVN